MRKLLIPLVTLIYLMVGVVSQAAEPAYKTEVWPEARKLFWANPGQDGKMKDPANWRTESGAIAEKGPDRNTDIVLPASDTIYDVEGSRRIAIRHAVVESGARFGGASRNSVEVWGNIEVRPGGRVLHVAIRGTKHTFVHLEEADFPDAENGQRLAHPTDRVTVENQCRSQLAHKFQIAKVGRASVEFIGNIAISDEVMLQKGKMIVSGDFRWSGITSKGSLEIYDGAILEIQSGGRVAPFENSNTKAVYNLNVYRNGTIQAGSPERPLTEDAYIMLGFAENDIPGRSGLYAGLGSMIRVYTSDPENARLIVTSITSDPEFHSGVGKLVGDPDTKAKGKTGITMQLAGDVDFDNTVFDYVSKGGIGLADPSQKERWSNVSFGPHCAGPEDALFSKLEADPNSYYHARGDMESEYNLTVMAMKSMDRFLNNNDPFRISTSPKPTEMRELVKKKEKITTPAAVIFDKPVSVKINSKVPGAKIRYTTDGLEPTKDSPLYEGPIMLSETTRLTVKAYKLGVGFSPTFTTTYVIQPKIAAQ
ncbi:MAG: chitobiase/beta-hexosaminidase C-terminal domain-containing protein [Verrucomicrobiota bacterium]